MTTINPRDLERDDEAIDRLNRTDDDRDIADKLADLIGDPR
jgi:hypothetical protein